MLATCKQRLAAIIVILAVPAVFGAAPAMAGDKAPAGVFRISDGNRAAVRPALHTVPGEGSRYVPFGGPAIRPASWNSGAFQVVEHHGGGCRCGECGCKCTRFGGVCNCDRGCDCCKYRWRGQGDPAGGHSGHTWCGCKLWHDYHWTDAGFYRIAYPLNPGFYDQRDGRIYAAQGYGIPMAVPLPANVKYACNRGWGVPSTRMSRVSRPTGPVIAPSGR